MQDFYSPHFSGREMTISQEAARHGIDNSPGADVERYLARLCSTVLEPMREHFGPLHISSGYRCPKVNALVGGASSSAHMEGRAADVIAPGASLRTMVEWLKPSRLPFDQVILEFGSWVHVAIARGGEAPRGQALMIFKAGQYLAYDPASLPPGLA